MATYPGSRQPGRPERAVDLQAGPVEAFTAELRGLRERAGWPSYRQLARQTHYSPTAICQAAGGDRLPSLDVTLAFVQAGGNPQEWTACWQRTAAQVSATGPDTAGPAATPGRRPTAALDVPAAAPGGPPGRSDEPHPTERSPAPPAPSGTARHSRGQRLAGVTLGALAGGAGTAAVLL